jgi:hypothetical protein
MATLKPQRNDSVEKRGADAGSVLRGAIPANQGLRLRIMQRQMRGDVGPLRGPFLLMDAGDNKHADALAGLVGKLTEAAEVLRAIREASPGCVSVVNVNILAAEGAADA